MKNTGTSGTGASSTTPVDLEEVCILLMRRFNALKEVQKITKDLAQAVDRGDEVTEDLYVTLRQDAFLKVDEAWQELRLLAEQGSEQASYMTRILYTPVEEVSPRSSMERKVVDLRRKTLNLIDEIKEQDRIVSLRTAKGQSYNSE